MRLSQEAREQMTRLSTLRVEDGATHLFEEPGALEEVASIAGDWFVRHLSNQWITVSKKKKAG